MGTPDAARALVRGICHAIDAEAEELASVYDHEHGVLLCLLADALDAADALGAEV